MKVTINDRNPIQPERVDELSKKMEALLREYYDVPIFVSNGVVFDMSVQHGTGFDLSELDKNQMCCRLWGCIWKNAPCCDVET